MALEFDPKILSNKPSRALVKVVTRVTSTVGLDGQNTFRYIYIKIITI